MNIYATIILAAVILDFVIGIIADRMNIKAMQPEIPPEFEGVYDADDYAKSQRYTATRTRFGHITGTFDVILLLAFWFLGGFNVLDSLIRDWGVTGIWIGLAYIGIIMVAKTIISLPFSVYSTFVIEERFGFNKTTPKTFILDRIKGLLLTIILGGPVLAVILAFFDYAGSFAWLYAWAVVTAFTLVIQFIAPRWIMPLFNKFTPLEDGDLKSAILNYAQSVKYSVQNIFIIDGSKRSSKSNAFFTGFGKNKRIALFDTLVEEHSVPQLVAVLAHEIGHFKKKHIFKGMIIGIAHTGLLFFLLSVFLSHKGLFDAFYMEHMSTYAGLLFFGMLYAPIDMVLSVILNAYSRKNEFEADRFAAETIEDPTHMTEALKILSRTNLSNLTPHPFYAWLHYSHPPVLQRITALKSVSRRPAEHD